MFLSDNKGHRLSESCEPRAQLQPISTFKPGAVDNKGGAGEPEEEVWVTEGLLSLIPSLLNQCFLEKLPLLSRSGEFPESSSSWPELCLASSSLQVLRSGDLRGCLCSHIHAGYHHSPWGAPDQPDCPQPLGHHALCRFRQCCPHLGAQQVSGGIRV